MLHPAAINKETGEYNPYLAGRQEWDSIHGTALKREQAWRWVAILSSLMAIISCAVALGLAINARSLKPLCRHCGRGNGTSHQVDRRSVGTGQRENADQCASLLG